MASSLALGSGKLVSLLPVSCLVSLLGVHSRVSVALLLLWVFVSCISLVFRAPVVVSGVGLLCSLGVASVSCMGWSLGEFWASLRVM